MIGFLSTSAWADVCARQRQIGRTLKRQFDAVAGQSVPDQMLDLLRRADARWVAKAGREFEFHEAGVSTTSLTVALAITTTLIASLTLYDIAAYAVSAPKVVAAGAFIAGLAATFAGAAWLIEGK
jgi:hypothetical protein